MKETAIAAAAFGPGMTACQPGRGGRYPRSKQKAEASPPPCMVLTVFQILLYINSVRISLRIFYFSFSSAMS